MLVLKREEGIIYNLTTKSEHSIGRHGVDLELPDDTSISRKHASIKVTVKNAKLKVDLRDDESMCGTYVNSGIEKEKRISGSITLKVGDRIKFGAQRNIWTLASDSFIVFVPLDQSTQDANIVKEIVRRLNGNVVSKWKTECSHFTAKSIKLSSTIINALASGKPIVTVDYWKRLSGSLTSVKEEVLPDYSDYLPNFTDTCSFFQFDLKMKASRRTLFKDFKFVAFGEEHCSRVSAIVESASGTVIDGNVVKPTHELLQNKNLIVVQLPNNYKETKAFRNYSDLLKRYQKRVVGEPEICLSVLHSSTEKYCNTYRDLDLFEQRDLKVTIKDNATVLETATQNQSQEDSGSNFSLTVNEYNKAFTGSHDESVSCDSPEMIQDSCNVSSNETGSGARSSSKRKSVEVHEKPAKFKKINFSIPRMNRETSDTSNDSRSPSTSSETCDKKSVKDIFSFQNPRKVASKSSSSLFANISEQAEHSSGCLLDTNTLGSIISDSLQKPRQIRDGFPETRRATSSLFARVTESPTLFSSHSQSKGDTNMSEETNRTNKRKMAAEELRPQKPRNMRSTKDLFELPTNSKKAKQSHVEVDSQDDTDFMIKNDMIQPFKSFMNNVPLPEINVPKTVSASQFVKAPKKNAAVKKEPLDVSSEVQELLNKTVVLTVSLVKSESRSDVNLNETSSSSTNFKKFKKNVVRRNSAPVPISTMPYCEPKQEKLEDSVED